MSASTHLTPFRIAVMLFALVATSTLLHAAPAKRAAFVDPVANPELPNVLLIGDSISIGYTLPVRQKLKNIANVYRPPVNCGDTRRGVEQIETWLGDRHWDVIHFNFGLHDLKHVDPKTKQLRPIGSPGVKQNVSVAEYAENLERIARRLRQTGATVIWRPTTPVPEGSNGRIAGDENRYNAAAAGVIDAVGNIQTDPVGQQATQPPILQSQLPANVHYTPPGSDLLADVIAQTIRGALNQR